MDELIQKKKRLGEIEKEIERAKIRKEELYKQLEKTGMQDKTIDELKEELEKNKKIRESLLKKVEDKLNEIEKRINQ